MRIFYKTLREDNTMQTIKFSMSTGITSNRMVLLLLALFYVPTLYDLSVRYWLNAEQSYNAIVAVAVAILFWTLRDRFAAAPIAPQRGWGLACLVTGLLSFVIGRALGAMALEVGSVIPVLAGVILITRGAAALRAYWLPILYLAFLVPVPTMIIDAVTGPLKVLVSKMAESALYALDFPVARMGVTLNIGKYQLLVADACSGLRSVFSLFALGLIYVHLLRRPGWIHNAILLGAIVPLALLTNFIRVMILMLVVYYQGEQVAQGFIHGFSGLILFAMSVLIFMGIDYVLLHWPRTAPSGTVRTASMLAG